MKKKIITLCLVIALAATAIIGGTLAYFTDTDTETNVFTTGNVKIDLVEQFEQGAKLMPGEWNKNAVPKVVTVKNTGSEDAYMWIELWIPSALDTIGNAGANSLHFNPWDTYKLADGTEKAMKGSEAAGLEKVAETVEVSLGQKEIDGVMYNGYREYIKNDSPKAENESTYALLSQVYMDSRVAQCTDATHKDCLILADGTTHYTGSWEIVVNAFGIQAEGFANIEEAIAAYNAN